MPTTADYLLIAGTVYTSYNAAPIAPQGWTLLTYQYDINSGMMGAAFKNAATNEIVIGYQGTNRTSGNPDWYSAQMSTNREIAGANIPLAYDRALAFANSVSLLPEAVGSSIFVAGHSLGGAFSQYVSIAKSYGGASFGGPAIIG